MGSTKKHEIDEKSIKIDGNLQKLMNIDQKSAKSININENQ